MGVHPASATAVSENDRFWTLGHTELKIFFPKYGHAVYNWKALEELNNFYNEP